MGYSIEENCMRSLETRLAALTLTNRNDGMGAETVTKVARDPEGVAENEEPPLIFIYTDLDETRDYLNVAQFVVKKQVLVRLLHARWEDSKEFSVYLISDLIKQIMRTAGGVHDQTLDGYADQLNVQATRSKAPRVSGFFPWATVEVLLMVQFRHAIDNPYVTVS